MTHKIWREFTPASGIRLLHLELQLDFELEFELDLLLLGEQEKVAEKAFFLWSCLIFLLKRGLGVSEKKAQLVEKNVKYLGIFEEISGARFDWRVTVHWSRKNTRNLTSTITPDQKKEGFTAGFGVGRVPQSTEGWFFCFTPLYDFLTQDTL